MARIHLILALCLVGTAAQPALHACGDKFLVLSRGTRFERPPVARHPANVLIYAPPSSPLPRALATLPVVRTLEKAGYRSTTLSAAADVAAAITRGGVDLVLLDLADAPALDPQLTGASAPAVLPVVFSQAKADARRAAAQYRCVVGKPGSTQSFLDAVDEALAQRRARRQ